MKISLLTGCNSRSAGGLFNSVKSLANELDKKESMQITVISHNDFYSHEDIITWGDLRMLIFTIIGPSNFGFTLDLRFILNEIEPDIIHQQGIWTYSSKHSLNYRKKFKSINIITPRGMLDHWAINNSKWKKKIIGNWYEYKNLRHADCLHALCYSEYKSIRSFGLKNPIAIIPNGVNLPIIGSDSKDTFKKKKRLLFIGRIHPKKGLYFLLETLNKIQNYDPEILLDWEFRIAGWSQNSHQTELEKICKEFKLNGIIKFIGSVYGAKKEMELRNADAFILPSYSEGLPMSILEAWSYKLPVIMTKECNIPEGFQFNAGIEIDHNLTNASNVLKIFFNYDSTELQIIGENGYQLVQNKFTWDKIAEQTEKMYNWLINKNKCPEFIHLN